MTSGQADRLPYYCLVAFGGFGPPVNINAMVHKYIISFFIIFPLENSNGVDFFWGGCIINYEVNGK